MVVPANIVPCSIGLAGGLLLVAIGVASTVGQLLSTEGFRYVEVARESLLGMLVPVLNYFLGVAVFGETISWQSIIGSAIVLGSCVIVLLRSDSN